MKFKRLVQPAGDQLLTQQSLDEATSKFVEKHESDREKSILQSGIATPSSSSMDSTRSDQNVLHKTTICPRFFEKSTRSGAINLAIRLID